MGRTVLVHSPGLFDVNGSAITSLSSATVLDGYSGAVNCAWADMVVFEVLDVATGTNVAPTGFTVETKARADQSQWAADLNFGQVFIGTGQAANFWRATAARMPVVAKVQSSFPSALVLSCEQIRCKITVAASANLFTPVIRAFVVRDAFTVSPVAS